jgi:hypothetical protein
MHSAGEVPGIGRKGQETMRKQTTLHKAIHVSSFSFFVLVGNAKIAIKMATIVSSLNQIITNLRNLKK